MKTLVLLALIWAPFVFFAWKIRRGWKGWNDFVQVFAACAFMGATSLVFELEVLRAVGLALSAGVAGTAILWAFGPGTLPASEKILATWDLFPEGRDRWQTGKLVCLATLWVSLGSCILWISRLLSATTAVLMTVASLALAITAVSLWRRTIQASQSA